MTEAEPNPNEDTSPRPKKAARGPWPLRFVWAAIAVVVIPGIGLLASALDLFDRFRQHEANSFVIHADRLREGESVCDTTEFAPLCSQMQNDVRQHFERQFPLLRSVAANDCRGSTEQAWLYERGYALLLRRYTSDGCADFASYQIATGDAQITKLMFVRTNPEERFEAVPNDFKTLAEERFEILEVIRYCEDIRPWDVIRADGRKFADRRSAFEGEVNLRRDELQDGDNLLVYSASHRADGAIAVQEREAVAARYDSGSSLWARLVEQTLPALATHAHTDSPTLDAQLARLCEGRGILENVRAHTDLSQGNWVTLPISRGRETDPGQYLIFIRRRERAEP